MNSAAPKFAAATSIFAEDLLRKEFWQAQFPELSIGAQSKAKPIKLGADALKRTQARMLTEGYFQEHDGALAKQARILARAVAQCVAMGIPAPFLFVFDEPWECFYRLHPLLTNLLGDGYLFLPDFWAWYIDPAKQESGWTPHRDKSRAALAADGSPLSLTLWIPLTEANPLNSCIYLLPADRDPVYNTDQEKQFQIPITEVRALPAVPGDILCWNQAVLHWGSHSSPFAPGPRISMALECQRGDIAAMNQPLIAPFADMDYTMRLKLIAKQILQYQHMYPLAPVLKAFAEKILAL